MNDPGQIRLAWHDAGTFDVNVKEWPKRGGANGSIRFKPEIDHGCNAGMWHNEPRYGYRLQNHASARLWHLVTKGHSATVNLTGRHSCY